MIYSTTPHLSGIRDSQTASSCGTNRLAPDIDSKHSNAPWMAYPTRTYLQNVSVDTLLEDAPVHVVSGCNNSSTSSDKSDRRIVHMVPWNGEPSAAHFVYSDVKPSASNAPEVTRGWIESHCVPHGMYVPGRKVCL